MVTDASVLRLMQVSRRAQGFNGLHGWKRALARIVERSHLDCRKPVRRFLRFTVSPDSETRIGTAAAPGIDRACHRSPARILGQGPPSPNTLRALGDGSSPSVLLDKRVGDVATFAFTTGATPVAGVFFYRVSACLG